MNLRTIIFALIAVAMAGGTALLLKGYLKSQRNTGQVVAKAPPPKPEMRILVAAKDLPAGHLIKPGDLSWRAWPRKGRISAYIVQPKSGATKSSDPPAKNAAKNAKPVKAPVDPMQDLTGAVVRFGIAGGEPIVPGRIVKPGSRGFMAAVLTPGMRAVSVPINATSGVAGFMFPGDRVDLIVTHSVKLFGATVAASKVSETVLTNIRVLAVDQRLDDQNAKPAIGKTATLEVTPKQAEVITVAVQIGRVSLSLRSLATGKDESEAARARRGRSFTRDVEISQFLTGRGPKKRRRGIAALTQRPGDGDGKDEVHVLRGSKATTEKFGATSEK